MSDGGVSSNFPATNVTVRNGAQLTVELTSTGSDAASFTNVSVEHGGQLTVSVPPRGLTIGAVNSIGSSQFTLRSAAASADAMLTASVTWLLGDGSGHMGVIGYTRLLLATAVNASSFVQSYVSSRGTTSFPQGSGTETVHLQWSRTFGLRASELLSAMSLGIGVEAVAS